MNTIKTFLCADFQLPFASVLLLLFLFRHIVDLNELQPN